MARDELVRHELHGMQPVLGVRDMEQTLAWYRDKLGFHIDFVAGDPPAHARVCSDASYASPCVFIRFEPREIRASGSPSAWLWLHVGNGLDDLFRTYRDRGVEIVQEPADRPWGLRQFVIKDCNDYLISFSEELQAAETEDRPIGSDD